MVRIIEYEDKYKEAVIDLWIQICIEEFGFEAWKNDIENMDNDTFYKDNGKFLLAVENDNVIGSISLKNEGDGKGFLKSFYVKKEYRANKIGLKLMEEMVQGALNLGYAELVLETYELMESAIRFYEKYGFKRIEHINDKITMNMTI